MSITIKLILIAALASSLAPAFASQTALSNENQELFVRIPEATRADFLARMDSVIRSQGARDWDGLYDLLAEPKPSAKPDFVRERKKHDRPGTRYGLEFKPDRLTMLEEGYYQKYQWIVTGCAKYVAGQQVEDHQSSMYAVFRDGNWYFSELMINVRCGYGDPDPCRPPKRSPRVSQ